MSLWEIKNKTSLTVNIHICDIAPMHFIPMYTSNYGTIFLV